MKQLPCGLSIANGRQVARCHQWHRRLVNPKSTTRLSTMSSKYCTTCIRIMCRRTGSLIVAQFPNKAHKLPHQACKSSCWYRRPQSIFHHSKLSRTLEKPCLQPASFFYAIETKDSECLVFRENGSLEETEVSKTVQLNRRRWRGF